MTLSLAQSIVQEALSATAEMHASGVKRRRYPSLWLSPEVAAEVTGALAGSGVRALYRIDTGDLWFELK